MENSANGHRHDDNGNKNSTTAAATTTATNQNDQTSSMTPKKFARTAPCRTSSRVKKKICLSSIVANNSGKLKPITFLFAIVLIVSF